MEDESQPHYEGWPDPGEPLRDLPLSLNATTRHEDLAAAGIALPGAPNLARAVNSILTASLAGHDVARCVSYSRRKGFYTGKARYYGPAYTYKNILEAVAFCENAGLIVHHKAERSSFTKWQSSFEASPGLVERFEHIRPELVAHDMELVRLTDTDGNLIAYRETDFTRRWRKELRGIRDVLRSVKFGLPEEVRETPRYLVAGEALIPRHSFDQPELHRVFNRASWKSGGRMYGAFWQSLPKAMRAGLTIDGQAVASADFSAIHPRMLYADRGMEMRGDPYELDGWERDDAKLALLIGINARTLREAIGAFCHKRKWTADRALALMEALAKRHAPIAGALYSDAGVALMRADSEIMVRAVRDLARADVCALPVHDELIVPAQNADLAAEIMARSFVARFPGVKPCPVKVIRPEVLHMVVHSAPALPCSPSIPPCLLVSAPTPEIQTPLRERELFSVHETAGVIPPHNPLAASGADRQDGGPIRKPTQTAMFFALPGGKEQQAVADYRGGLMPADVARAVRETRRTLQIRQEDMAAAIGISRPQLANAEQGRFGLGKTAAAKLTALIAEGVQRGAA